ncbi:hypothetical protein C8J57DRAFT_1231804 [Mycena rebaudengoi]|nr:hypothetical protein C8J57DRAFT_1231804 [Mycena rebaudengoi]
MAASHGPAAAALSGAVATRNREVSERAREEGRSKRQDVPRRCRHAGSTLVRCLWLHSFKNRKLLSEPPVAISQCILVREVMFFRPEMATASKPRVNLQQHVVAGVSRH